LERAVEGVGSGFIVHPDGYIITNNHVVNENSKNVKVYLGNGSVLPGKVLWTDAILDLTILKIDAKNLPVIELGNSDNLSVGQTAIAIGNPL
ncbi:MAG: S1C family serine protease, partial [Caldanaerobacter sp.]